MTTTPRLCALCLTRPARSRHLCPICYKSEAKHGRIHLWAPFRNRKTDELVRPVVKCVRCTLPTTSKRRICADCAAVLRDLGEYTRWAS